MVADSLHKNQNQANDIESWFDGMVANLRYDQTLLENEIIDDNKRKVYDAMISGNQEFMHNFGRQASSAYFITKMIESYLKELIKTQSKPNKLAFELSDSKILVWAEISEDDETMEDGLILAEAKINAEFTKFGFHISSTIVENSDKLEVPNHYKNIAIC